MSIRWLVPLSLLIMLFGGVADSLAATAETTPGDAPPVEHRTLPLTRLAQAPIELTGLVPSQRIDFGVRDDRLVTRALLDLHYTPSPALLDDVSQLKVYLNDEVVGVVSLEPDRGKPQHAEVSLDPRLIRDYNRLELSLIGHYKDICENPVHTSIWLDIGNDSHLELTEQALPLANSLARLPGPFFDSRDDDVLDLPIVLPESPDLAMQRAGGIVASWFGSLADWRGQHFPVTFDQPPRQHAVVLATNEARPAFLANYPPVDGPTVEIISHPDTPYVKLLLVLGRDNEDLLEAARALALGDVLLHGQSARIEAIDTLEPRRPYDAPKWVPTDRPVSFDELVEYPDQLQIEGGKLDTIDVNLRVPPDLFVWENDLIDLDLGYRYTPPATEKGSRLDIAINGEFLRSFPLSQEGSGDPSGLEVPVLQDWLGAGGKIAIPALRLGAANRLSFDFNYANRVGGAEPDKCITVTQVPNRAAIDEASTLDFSGYPHYLAMPALRTFATAGFPFSRLADLSQTLVVMPSSPSAEQLSSLFDTLGRIGAQTGYPGVAVSLTDDWQQVREVDADILAFGSLPESLSERPPVMALGPDARSRLRLASRDAEVAARHDPLDGAPVPADRSVTISAHGPLAAVLEMQSPFFDQRSVVALLTAGPADQRLLNRTLAKPSALDQISGSVAVIRDSGITSNTVGERYYVGHLPWMTWLWYHLSRHPWLIAAMAGFAVLVVAFLLWRILRRLGAKRLSDDEA
ncbi:cellulose biosynthesis cyclic di-GMP-binding regulatory protein BcsB [Halomonas sp. HP20-15]|uniref:cellulose biosynthesis cyclic di-GMP-binding regulatory protein BcsB n=1 Tax=Halomonas sp. HP20-15 TaxID=3085901 RepID=UPI00298279FD|nr:cellulose biosynthesis cyclic di-GMP-binding regulatory protein BcsB [Halomonas sp. HP20-15]MDW5377128.1 cellulose biosynthesis cyclic di-GMP-binding regulatory protein BcsB [Halomonas sp. HP20-15]